MADGIQSIPKPSTEYTDDALLVFEYRASEKAFRRDIASYLWRSGIFYCYFTAVILLTLLFNRAVSGTRFSNDILQIIGIGIFATLLFYGLYSSIRRTAQQAKSFTISMREDCFGVFTDEFCSEIKWSHISAIKRSRHFISVFSRDTRILWIPIECLDSTTLEKLTTILDQKRKQYAWTDRSPLPVNWLQILVWTAFIALGVFTLKDQQTAQISAHMLYIITIAAIITNALRSKKKPAEPRMGIPVTDDNAKTD